MLRSLIGWSLAHRALVLTLWFVICVAGVVSFLHLPMDAFPDTTPVQVQVNTLAPALSPLEIERQVTTPIEQALTGTPELTELRSISKFGYSQVTLVFEADTDLWRARQMVSERLNAVTLPARIARPQMGPVATGLGEVFHYLVRGEGRSLAELRAVQDWIVKPQLRTLPGVAEINSWGGDERRVEVVVDPLNLQKFGLSLDDLTEALETNNHNVGGGTWDRAGEATLVQGVAVLTSPEEIGQVVIAAHQGVPVRVSDVATVQEGRAIRRGAVTASGQGEVVLGLGFMLMGENSHDVTTRLATRLDEIRKNLPEGVEVTPVYLRTTLVDQVLHTVETNLMEGALLVVVIILLFLGSWRAGLIVACVIPISLLFAANLMLDLGVAGSLMSLGALDFGLVVDSAIIQVENAARRLGIRRLSLPEGGQLSAEERRDVVREAAVEVLTPTMFGQLVIMAVYLPILTLEGVEGRMFRPMALTVIFALTGATLASLTLIPVLSSLWLSEGAGDHDNRLIRLLKRAYSPTLQAALNHPLRVLTLAALLLLNGGFLASRLGWEFIPRLGEGTMVINTVRLASVAVEESVRYGTQIEKMILAKFPDEVEEIWTRTGTAEIATDPMGLELSDIFVTLKAREQWTRATTQAELTAEMQQSMSALPGMRMIFTQPIEMRVNEMAAGIRADVGFKVYGDDFGLLREKARQIEAIVRSVSGSADVVTEQLTGLPMLRVEVDRGQTARHGVSAGEVLELVEAFGGLEVGEIQEGERRYPMVIRLSPRYGRDLEAFGALLVNTPNGDRVPLSQLTRRVVEEGPSTIQREWARRRVVVQSNVRGRDVGSFVEEIVARIDAEVTLPTGYFVRVGGQFEHLEQAWSRLLIVVPATLGLIFGLLVLTYRSLRDAARVFTGVPFAAVGGIVALWLRDLPFSVSAAVGFVALSGVSVLADMVLVSAIRRHQEAGMGLRDAVEAAALERLRPVLMTALVASLGFLPMALNTGVGAEVQRPLATVVMGGLFSSTTLTLLVLPVLVMLTVRQNSGSRP